MVSRSVWGVSVLVAVLLWVGEPSRDGVRWRVLQSYDAATSQGYSPQSHCEQLLRALQTNPQFAGTRQLRCLPEGTQP